MEKPITPLGNLDFLISNWRKLKHSEKEDVIDSCSLIYAQMFPSKGFILKLRKEMIHINNQLARSPRGGILLNKPSGGARWSLDKLLSCKAHIEAKLIDLFERLNKKKGGRLLHE